MKQIPLGPSGLTVPTIAVGCMRLAALSEAEASHLIEAAIDEGAYLFDHADIYGGGECESLFARAYRMNDDRREKILLQSKCGIRQGMYDFSREHILSSVDGILQRLQTDYLDVLLLHRPDALCDPEEVADAFDRLYTSGKVRYFGVSNHNSGQIRLLQKYLRQPLVANQLQLSITNAGMIRSGLNVNMENDASIDHDGSVLDFCRLSDITIQPWSPFQYGFFEGVFLGSERYGELNRVIGEVAARYHVSDTAIVIAWLLRHPAHFQPVTGTTNLERLRDICRACDIVLTRKEWYDIFLAAGNVLP